MFGIMYMYTVLLLNVCELTAQHVIVGTVCNGVDVRRRLRAAFALVGSDHRSSIDRQPFVWIDCHTEEARVRLRKQEDMTQHSFTVMPHLKPSRH